MPHRPDIAELMLALDDLEDVKQVLFDKFAPSEWEMRAEREMVRALAVLHAHLRALLDAEV